MKRYYVLLIAFALSAAGCKKFLTEEPYSIVSIDAFYKTATDAELATTGLYDILTAGSIAGQGGYFPTWGRSMHYLNNMGCDEIIGDVSVLSADAPLLALCNYTYNSENTYIWYTYAALYAGINRANLIIERVPSINMDATRRRQIVGEAHFIRGLCYTYLGWLWGGVPLADSTSADLKSPRVPLVEVMKHAEADFKFAYDALPSRNPIVGRINKYCAAGYLAKIYLYQAGCKENKVNSKLNFPLNNFDAVNVDSCYKNALYYTRDIYNNSGYSLLKPLNYLFLTATEDQARSEHMLIAQFGVGGTGEYNLYTYLAGPSGNYLLVAGTYGCLRPVREAYMRFNANDGRRALCFSGNIATTAGSTTINGYKYFTPEVVQSSLANLNFNKYREDDTKARVNRGLPTFAGETDFGILRFADIVLMYAEAKYKTGDETGARALLRELRFRACNDDIAKVNAITAAYNTGNFMAELLDERSRELMTEGWRRIDLIRFGKLESTIANLDPTVMFTRQDVPAVINNFRDYKIWYPLPSRDIATNPNLVQNPGY